MHVEESAKLRPNVEWSQVLGQDDGLSQSGLELVLDKLQPLSNGIEQQWRYSV